MAGSASYKPNHKGFQQMLTGPQIRKVLAEHAAKGKAFAEALSQDFRDTGRYSESFEVDVTTAEFKGEPRAVAVLRNTAPYAAAVEWGYRGRRGEPSTSAHRVLGRTAEFLGAAEE